jgi:trigger factor
MLEKTVDEMVADFEQAVKHEAHLSLEDYLRLQGQTMEELRDELEPRAAARLRRSLVLREVIVREGLEVDEEEIGAHVEEVSASWGVRADEVRMSLSSDAGRRVMHSRLLADKAMRRLVAIARGEAPELALTEEQKGERTEEQETESGQAPEKT